MQQLGRQVSFNHSRLRILTPTTTSTCQRSAAVADDASCCYYCLSAGCSSCFDAVHESIAVDAAKVIATTEANDAISAAMLLIHRQYDGAAAI